MCGTIGIGSRLVVTVDNQKKSQFDTLEEARKAAKDNKGNEAIVRNDDGSYSIHSITDNPNQEKQIIEMAEKGQVSTFDPRVVEFSVSGLWNRTINIENTSGEIIDKNMSEVGSEIRGAYLSASKTGKNEFATEEAAIAAAKQHSGIEAIVKGQDSNGNVVYKLYRATQEDIEKLKNNPEYKGKVTAFVVPPSFLGSEKVIRVGAPKENIVTGNTSTTSSSSTTSSTNISSTTSTSSTTSSTSSPQSSSTSSTSSTNPSAETSDYNYGYDFDYDFILGPYSPYMPGEISFPVESSTSSTSGTTTSTEEQTTSIDNSSSSSINTNNTFSVSKPLGNSSNTGLLGNYNGSTLLLNSPISGFGSAPNRYPSLSLSNNLSYGSSFGNLKSDFGLGLYQKPSYMSGFNNYNFGLSLNDYSSFGDDLGAKVEYAEKISSSNSAFLGSDFKFDSSIGSNAESEEDVNHAIDNREQNIEHNQQAFDNSTKQASSNISKMLTDSNNSFSLTNSVKNITVNDLGDLSKYAKNPDGSTMTEQQLRDFASSSLKNIQEGKPLTPRQSLILSSIANFTLKNEKNLDPKIKETLESIVKTGSGITVDMEKFELVSNANNAVIKALEEKKNLLVSGSAEYKATEAEIEARKKINPILESDSQDINKSPSQEIVKSTLEVESVRLVRKISSKNYSDAMNDINAISGILNDRSKNINEKVALINSQFPDIQLSSLVNMKLLNENSLDILNSKINSLKSDLESIGESKHNQDNNANSSEQIKELDSKIPQYTNPIKLREEIAQKTNLIANEITSLDAKKSNSINEKIFQLISEQDLTIDKLPENLRKYAVIKDASGKDVPMTPQQLKEFLSTAIQNLKDGKELTPREIILLSGASANLLKDTKLDRSLKSRLEYLVHNGQALSADMEKFKILNQLEKDLIKELKEHRKNLVKGSLEYDANEARINVLEKKTKTVDEGLDSNKLSTEALILINEDKSSELAVEVSRLSPNKIRKIESIMKDPNKSIQDKIRSLKDFGLDTDGIIKLLNNNQLDESILNNYMNSVFNNLENIGDDVHEQQINQHQSNPDYQISLTNLRKLEDAKELIDISELISSYAKNIDCPFLKFANSSEILSLEKEPIVAETPKEDKTIDATQTVIRERANEFIKIAERMENDFSENDQIDVSGSNIIHLLREFQRINNEHSLAANNIKQSVNKRTGIDRKFSESLKENRERWNKLDETKKEYITNFKSSNEVQKPMLPSSVKKAFDNFEVSKEKNLKILSKLEYTMKTYQDLIDKGEKPSMKLCMELNSQLDLYKAMCRENDKLFSHIQKILK